VRTGDVHGFKGDFRHLNVACSRGILGFYLVARAPILKIREGFGQNSPSNVFGGFKS
jgi:hypothetical protein